MYEAKQSVPECIASEIIPTEPDKRPAINLITIKNEFENNDNIAVFFFNLFSFIKRL